MESPDISVVVLAYRSDSTIEGFVTSLVTSLEEEKIDWEIIFCQPVNAIASRPTLSGCRRENY